MWWGKGRWRDGEGRERKGDGGKVERGRRWGVIERHSGERDRGEREGW